MADLAGFHLFAQRFQGFLQRGEVLFLVAIAELAEEVGAALRPVQLVEVDPVGLQALEAIVQRRDYVLAIVLELAAADVVDAVAGAGDLARQHPVGAVATGLEVVADDAFGGAVGVAARRDRVHLGGIEEVDAAGLGAVDLGETLGLAVLFAPGHAAQAQGADLQIAAAQLAIFHVLLLGSTAKAKHKAGCYFCSNRHNSAAFSAGMPSPCEKEGGDA